MAISNRIYVLRRGSRAPPDMRLCDPFVVFEIRKQHVPNAKAVVIAYHLLCNHDEWLTEETLGFDRKVLGEGELLLTNRLSAIDPDHIVCKRRSPSSPYQFLSLLLSEYANS